MSCRVLSHFSFLHISSVRFSANIFISNNLVCSKNLKFVYLFIIFFSIIKIFVVKHLIDFAHLSEILVKQASH